MLESFVSRIALTCKTYPGREKGITSVRYSSSFAAPAAFREDGEDDFDAPTDKGPGHNGFDSAEEHSS